MPFIGNQPTAVPLTSADITDGIITSAKIADGTIVNADINASAAIDASKLTGLSSDYVLLATNSVSNAASASLDGYFSSTYRVYYLHILDYYGSTSANLRCRFRRSNTDVTTSNYTYASIEAYRSVGGAGSDYFAAWNDNFGRLDYNGFSSTRGFSNSILTFYNPSDSTSYKTCQVNSISSVSTGDEIANNNGMIQLRDNTNAISGVTVYASTGNIYATLKLYGVKA